MSETIDDNDYLLDLAGNAENDQERDFWIDAYNGADLKTRMLGCNNCGLRKNCVQVVTWSGPWGSRPICFLGDYPEEEDDLDGLPFTEGSRNGKVLKRALDVVGIGRDSAAVLNLVGCYPPANRYPRENELAACNSWVEEQIALINPWLIVAMGNMAFRKLDSKLELARCHGKIFKIKDGNLGAGRWGSGTLHPRMIKKDNLIDFESDMSFYGQVWQAHVLMGGEILDFGIERTVEIDGYWDWETGGEEWTRGQT